MRKSTIKYIVGSTMWLALTLSISADPLLRIASDVVASSKEEAINSQEMATEVVAASVNSSQAEFIEIIGARIVGIDEVNKQMSILPPHLEDSPYNYIVLNITDETLLSVGLKVGDCVNVKHGVIMTASLPPQVVAYEVFLQGVTRTKEGIELKGAIVKAINKEAKQIIILPAQVENHPFNYIVLNTGNKTIISGGIEEGDRIDVRHALVMTKSLPPQTIAYEMIEVKEMKQQMPETVTIDCATIKDVNKETGQVTILPTGVEDAPMNDTVLNTSKEHTLIRHEINRRAYHLADLKEGMKIQVKHSPIMTMSLPPQTPAVEIIILQNQETCK